MNNEVLKVAGLMLGLDAIWLSINAGRYQSLVYNVQGSALKIRYTPAIIAYVMMLTSFFLFVRGLKHKKHGLMYAFMFGTIIYGIFNATNLAIFEKYSYTIAILDTLWGACLYTLLLFLV